jgi:hypothetical protein
MIDEAIRTIGKASIQLGLSDGALKEWLNWIYGEPMTSNCDTDYFEPHLELYEYCHENSRPKVDYECANACLDGTREMLTIGLDELGADEVFGSGTVPTLAELVSRLDKHNEKGSQMLVDLLVHCHYWHLASVADLIQETQSVPSMASFFQNLSHTFAVKSFNATQEDEPEHAISAPHPMSPHAYHSYGDGDTACCGRRLHAPIAYE